MESMLLISANSYFEVRILRLFMNHYDTKLLFSRKVEFYLLVQANAQCH